MKRDVHPEVGWGELGDAGLEVGSVGGGQDVGGVVRSGLQTG